MKILHYAGIGPRKTPEHIQNLMTDLAEQLSETDWCLRSGHATGADQAFGRGATLAQVFLPWEGYNDARSDNERFGHLEVSEKQYEIARTHHPAWDKCSDGARLLLCRNVPIILGESLEDPAKCVITWTPDPNYRGGTTHALKIASTYGVPVFDVRKPADFEALCVFTEREEALRTEKSPPAKPKLDLPPKLQRA